MGESIDCILDKMYEAIEDASIGYCVGALRHLREAIDAMENIKDSLQNRYEDDMK